MTPQTEERLRTAISSIRIGVLVLSVIATGFTLFALRPILTPLALAVFLALVIDGLAQVLAERTPFPKRAALPAAIVLILVTFGLAIWLVAYNGGSFAEEAPAFQSRIDHILQQVSTQFGVQVPSTGGELMRQLNPAHWVGVIAKAARDIVEKFVFVLIYLGFLLASRQGMKRKLDALLSSNQRQQEVARVIERVRRGVESYVFVQTVVGVVIAVLSVLIMWPLGLKHVFFFAFFIFLANYVPAIGAAVGVLVPPLFGVLELDELWRPVVMLIGLEAVHFGVSHILQPRLQGKQLNLDPIFVLLGLTFWGVLWGLPGAFLSTPLTVAVMALLAEHPDGRWAAVILSSDGKPFAEEAEKADPRPDDLPEKKKGTS